MSQISVKELLVVDFFAISNLWNFGFCRQRGWKRMALPKLQGWRGQKAIEGTGLLFCSQQRKGMPDELSDVLGTQAAREPGTRWKPSNVVLCGSSLKSPTAREKVHGGGGLIEAEVSRWVSED
jgi:hypothetical protein